MADRAIDLRPIQVFLDARRFIELEEPQPFGGGSKDFFKDNDRGFAEPKAHVQGRIKGAAESLRRTKQPAGFVKVRQREEALAKSHRPLGRLFSRSNQFALVGADAIGELLFQATPAALDRLAHISKPGPSGSRGSPRTPRLGSLNPACPATAVRLAGLTMSDCGRPLIR
jgi:hypothetical protein